jgi:hypothetical protein
VSLLRSRNLPIYGSRWERTFLQKPILKRITGGGDTTYIEQINLQKCKFGADDWADMKLNGVIPFPTSGQPSGGCHSTYSFYIHLIISNFEYGHNKDIVEGEIFRDTTFKGGNTIFSF